MSLIDAYRKKLAAQIQEHKGHLDLLKAKARKFAAESKVVGQAELAVADKQFDQVKARFKELKGAGGVAFQDIRTGVKKALADLQVSTKKAARHFKSEAAPAKPTRPHARRQTKPRPAKVKRAKPAKRATAKAK